MSTIFDHPDWSTLSRFLYIRRGIDGANGPRHRIEVRHDAPRSVFAIRVSCAHCGAEMTPVREDARGAWTYNVSCPLAVSVKCARMPESAAMAAAIRRAIGAEPPLPRSATRRSSTR